MGAPERKGHARLTLQIKREGQEQYDEYTVIPFRQERGLKLYKMTKEDLARPYIVGYDKECNGPTCNCPDQMKNRPKGGCKHIKALKAFWLIF